MADDVINSTSHAHELRTAASSMRLASGGGSMDLTDEYPALDLITADLLDGYALHCELAPGVPLSPGGMAALATARRINGRQDRPA